MARVRASPLIVGVFSVALLSGALAVLYLSRSPIVNPDTADLLSGVGQIDACLRSDVLSSCGKAGPYYSTVGPFPIVQYIPALIVKWIGGHSQDAFRLLVILNGLACVLMVAVMWRVLAHRGRAVAATGVAVLLTSPFLWYSHHGLGEPLAAALTLLFAAALVTRTHPVLLGLAAFGAALTKEIAPLFLALLAVSVLASRERSALRRDVAVVASGLAGAVIVAAAFNQFRYGSVVNTNYLQPAFRMPWSLRPQYLLALLVSPTNGIVWVWASAVAVLAGSVFVALRRGVARGPIPWILLMLAGLLVQLASWFGPFGANAWGSRLLMPWIPALVLVVLWFYGQELIEVLARRLRTSRGAFVVCAALLIVGLPHLGVVVDSSRFAHPWPGESVFKGEVAYAAYYPSATCPRPVSPTANADYYYGCLHEWTWERGFAMARALPPLAHGYGPLFAALYALALAGVLYYGRVTKVPGSSTTGGECSSIVLSPGS